MKSEKKIFIFLLLLGLIPLGVVSFIDYYYAKKSLQEEVLENLESLASHKIEMVDKTFQRFENKVIAASKRPFVIRQTKGILQCYTKDEKQYQYYIEQLDILAKNYISLNEFYDIFIIAPNGDIVYTVKKEKDFQSNIHQRPARGTLFEKVFNKTLKTDSLAISSFRIYEPSQRPANFITTPIKDENGHTIAIFAVQMDIDILYDEIMTNSKYDKTLESILVDIQDDYLMILNPLKFDKSLAFKKKIRLDSPQAQPIVEAFNGKNGQGEHIDYRGENVLMVWNQIPKLGIVLILKEDTKEAYAKIGTIRYSVVGVALLVFLMISYIFFQLVQMIKDLNRQKERYEMAVDGANEGLWEWNLASRTVTLSKRAQEILGYNKAYFHTFRDVFKLIHPDDLKKLKKFIHEVFQNKKPYKTFYRIKQADGTYIWVLDRAKVIYEDNKVVRIIGFITDITKEKELEEKIRKTKEFFELILDSFPYIVVIKKMDGKVIYANKKAKQFVHEDIVGKNPIENIGEEAGKKVLQLAKEAIQHTKAEAVIPYTKGSKQYYFHTLAFVIPKENGELLIGATYYDVTKHEIMKKELHTKDELMIIQSRYAAMGEMIGMIAHQWRQPITSIAMDVNNMLGDIDLDLLDIQEFKKSLRGILEQINYLSRTIDDFRNFFKSDKEQREVVIVDVLNDALKIIGKSLSNNDIDVVVKDNSISKVKIYERELLQVFINLLLNAKDSLIENQKEDKKVTIVIDEGSDYIRITICDNGGGIKNDIMPKIFEPYFSTKKQKQGTGLGLYMSKTIVDKHLYGTLHAFNSKEGACFEINLYKENIK
ncbi:MAG: PAS domain S-box protein [Epsilonproteobacteria bacterium]|nr:PAS domain S-box protein [Campylobacterota bacterium]